MKRKLFKILTALILAVLILNAFAFLYYRPVGWIDRTDSATEAIWNPGKILIESMEGSGIYRSDANGYLNPDILLGGGIPSW